MNIFRNHEAYFRFNSTGTATKLITKLNVSLRLKYSAGINESNTTFPANGVYDYQVQVEYTGVNGEVVSETRNVFFMTRTDVPAVPYN